MLSSKDFIKDCNYNADTKNQLWCSNIADSHDTWCGCPTPFAHLLSSIFPPGHTDRNKTIEEILARDYKELCHSGGDAEEKTGIQAEPASEKDGAEEKGYIADAELQDLIDFGESAAGVADER